MTITTTLIYNRGWSVEYSPLGSRQGVTTAAPHHSSPPAAPTVGKTWSDWDRVRLSETQWDRVNSGTLLLVSTVTSHIIVTLSLWLQCGHITHLIDPS